MNKKIVLFSLTLFATYAHNFSITYADLKNNYIIRSNLNLAYTAISGATCLASLYCLRNSKSSYYYTTTSVAALSGIITLQSVRQAVRDRQEAEHIRTHHLPGLTANIKKFYEDDVWHSLARRIGLIQ